MLFGTSGIRGDAEKLMTDQFCFDIGRTFVKFLENHDQKGAIGIGMDPRFSSQRIKECFSMGVLYEDRNVFDEGITPVPAMNHLLIIDNDMAGSVMITGSHIRADFNGMKFFAFKKEILKEHEKEIEDIHKKIKRDIINVDSTKINMRERIIGDIKKEDIANKLYQKMLFNLAEYPFPKWKIVLDLGNGCQSKIMPSLFKKLNIKTVIINDVPTSDKFIARDTEEEGVIKDLQEKVIEENADLGIAYDGDGDRVVFVDGDGNFIPGDYSGSLIAKYGNSPSIVVPINVSQVVEYIGKPVIRTKVGSPYVVKAIEENGATFGFEANGGGISKDIMLSRDAGSMTIKILNLLKDTNKNIGELINILPRFYISRTKVDCPVDMYSHILENVKREFKGIRIEEIDGLKIWIDNKTWILFRPSSNAPEFRVFAESERKEDAIKLCESGIKFVKQKIETKNARIKYGK